MRITFTGKQDKLSSTQERKLATAFGNLGKLVERKGERSAQVALSTQRHLQVAEVRVNFYGQTLVGEGAGTDQFLALSKALDNVEKQAQKARAKWREAKRDTPARKLELEIVAAEPGTTNGTAKAGKAAKKEVKKAAKTVKPAQVVQAGKGSGKPMTVDEAMLTLEDGRDYTVYRDAATDKVRVLIRRRDGKVDLVEA